MENIKMNVSQNLLFVLTTSHEADSKDNRFTFYKNSSLASDKWHVKLNPFSSQFHVDKEILYKENYMMNESLVLNEKFTTLKQAQQTIKDIFVKAGVLPPSQEITRSNFYYFKQFEEIAIIYSPTHKSWMYYLRDIDTDKPHIKIHNWKWVFIKELSSMKFEKRLQAVQTLKKWLIHYKAI